MQADGFFKTVFIVATAGKVARWPKLIVFGALIYPFVQQGSLVLGQAALDAIGHGDRRAGVTTDEHVQGAGQAGAGLYNWTKLCAFHQALVGAQVKSTLLITLAAWNVTAQAIILKDGVNIFFITDFLLR